MQNAALVRVMNGFGDDPQIARGAAKPFRIPHFAFRIKFGQALPFHVIHREIVLS